MYSTLFTFNPLNALSLLISYRLIYYLYFVYVSTWTQHKKNSLLRDQNKISLQYFILFFFVVVRTRRWWRRWNIKIIKKKLVTVTQKFSRGSKYYCIKSFSLFFSFFLRVRVCLLSQQTDRFQVDTTTNICNMWCERIEKNVKGAGRTNFCSAKEFTSTLKVYLKYRV